MHILNLGLVVPLRLLAARWLGRRRPWGLTAVSVLLVKGVTVGLSLLAANGLAVLAGTTADGRLNALWVVIAAGSAWTLVVILRHVDPTTPPRPGPESRRNLEPPRRRVPAAG